MSKAVFFLSGFLVAFPSFALMGQLAYKMAGSEVFEDFDGLDPSFQGGAPHLWSDDVTLPNWYSNLDEYYANSNPAETSRLYNLREGSSSTDQTLGSVPGLAVPEIHKAMRLVNETGRTLTSVALAYDGQQWRNSGNDTVSELAVHYRVGGAELEGGFWQAVPALTFEALHTGGAAVSLNGNLAANSERKTFTLEDGFSWAPGEELWIRWTHSNHIGFNHALGIDNVLVSAFAPFESAGLRGGWLWGAGTHSFGSIAIIGDLSREDETIQLLRAWEIGRIYTSISASRIGGEPGVIHAWNRKVFNQGIEPHLLLSRVAWLDLDNWGDLHATLQGQFLDFNTLGIGGGDAFAAIHFDVEPQVLAEWPSFDAGERRNALEDLLGMLQEARAYLNANGAVGARVSAAIPHWYDRLPPALGGNGRIGWASTADRDDWYDRLAQAVDGVVIMAFNLSATAVLDATQRVRDTFGGEVIVSLRVEGPEWNSLSDMWAAAEEVEAVTGGGIDIQPLHRFAEFTAWRLRPSYAAWRDAFFDEVDRENDAISGPLAQPVNEGVPNLLKYAFGFGAGPVYPVRLPSQEFQEVNGGGEYPALRFRRLVQPFDLTYTVETTADLFNWTELPDEEIYSVGPTGPGTEEALGVDKVSVGDVERRFMRVRVDHEPMALTYRQNFDSLNPQFTNIYGDGHDWIDDQTLPGWFASLDRYFSTRNPVEGNRLFNLREGSSSTNLSLGSVPAGTSGDIHVAKRLINETNAAIDSLSLAYTGEQWRNSGNSRVSTLVVAYRVGGGGIADGLWNAIPELTFTAPKTGGDAQLLDGKTGSNRESLRHYIDEIDWPPGQELWLRWTHENHGGMNHGLSIDDLEVDAFFAPAL